MNKKINGGWLFMTLGSISFLLGVWAISGHILTPDPKGLGLFIGLYTFPLGLFLLSTGALYFNNLRGAIVYKIIAGLAALLLVLLFIGGGI